MIMQRLLEIGAVLLELPAELRVPVLLQFRERRCRRGQLRIAGRQEPRDEAVGQAMIVGDRLPEQRRQVPAVGRQDATQQQADLRRRLVRSEEHTSELQSLMRISYAVFCLKKNKK